MMNNGEELSGFFFFDEILQSEIWIENNAVAELSKRSKQNMKKDLETAFESLWREYYCSLEKSKEEDRSFYNLI